MFFQNYLPSPKFSVSVQSVNASWFLKSIFRSPSGRRLRITCDGGIARREQEAELLFKRALMRGWVPRGE